MQVVTSAKLLGSSVYNNNSTVLKYRKAENSLCSKKEQWFFFFFFLINAIESNVNLRFFNTILQVCVTLHSCLEYHFM